MDEFSVMMTPRAYRDLDGIYQYILDNFKETDTAKKLIQLLEKAIYALNTLPHRGAPRKTGTFANKNYRQIFVKNFTVVYRIENKRKQVIVVAIKYTPSNF